MGIYIRGWPWTLADFMSKALVGPVANDFFSCFGGRPPGSDLESEFPFTTLWFCSQNHIWDANLSEELPVRVA